MLKSAKSNRCCSTARQAVDGKTVAVSGTVAVPKGKAPKGGWPVITWAHGTVGIADACAPSHRSACQASYDSPLLNRWLKAGYAVVRTDYEGLGTPGDAPVPDRRLRGPQRARHGRAPRASWTRTIGKNVVIAGHSQGGHAALWAGSLAKKWTPELKLRGTVALRPGQPPRRAGRAAARADLAERPQRPRGDDRARHRHRRPVAERRRRCSATRRKALYPQIDEKCLDGLDEPDSFGGLAPADLFRARRRTSRRSIAALNANDPETLKIAGPVLIEQGKADTTVFPSFTDQLDAELKSRGVKVTYKTYDGVDHARRGRRQGAANDATKWIEKRARLEPGGLGDRL